MNNQINNRYFDIDTSSNTWEWKNSKQEVRTLKSYYEFLVCLESQYKLTDLKTIGLEKTIEVLDNGYKKLEDKLSHPLIKVIVLIRGVFSEKYKRNYNLDIIRNKYIDLKIKLIEEAAANNQAEEKDIETFRIILKNPTISDHFVLFSAMQQGYLDVVKFLLQHKRINSSIDNNTLINFAAKNRQTEIVQFLMGNQVGDLSTKDKSVFKSFSLLDTLPTDILKIIGTTLSFQDLNSLALTGKFGRGWADIIFDFFAKEILCSGQTLKERKCGLAKLYREVSPNFIRSLNDDIDKIKNRRFKDGSLAIEYGENSYTPFFLINFASKLLDQVPGCEEIAREYVRHFTQPGKSGRIDMLNYYYPPNTKHSGIIGAGSTGIKINQTPSNHVADITSPKLIEAFKKSSEIFFKKLYEICTIPDLTIDNNLPDKEKLEKYKNKCALVIYEKDKKKLSSCHCAIAWLLEESGLSNRVDFLNYNTLTGVYGEKEDIQKFVTILYAQQFPNIPPSMATLRQARGILNLAKD